MFPRRNCRACCDQLHAALKPAGVLFSPSPRGDNDEGWNGDRYGAYHDLAAWRRYVSNTGFTELEHYYRPTGLPREQQPWLASVWRHISTKPLRPPYEAALFTSDDSSFVAASNSSWAAEGKSNCGQHRAPYATSLRRIESCSGASMPILTRRPVPPSNVIRMGPLANSCASVMLASTPSAGWITIDSSTQRLITSTGHAFAGLSTAGW